MWPLVLGRMFDYSIRSMVSESCSMTVPGPKPHTSSLTGFARGQASLPGPCASFHAFLKYFPPSSFKSNIRRKKKLALKFIHLDIITPYILLSRLVLYPEPIRTPHTLP